MKSYTDLLSLNTFFLALREGPNETPDASLYPGSRKNHAHTWPKLASNFFGETKQSPSLGLSLDQPTVMLLSCCCWAVAFDVSSFAVIDRC